MKYRRQVLQIHNTIKKSGNKAVLDLIIPTGVNPTTGRATGETVYKVFFVKVNYTTEELSDGSLVEGLSKYLISTISPDGQYLQNLPELLKNKKATVRLAGGTNKLSIKASRITAPDGVTPLAARLFVGA